jgi:hypothetical protein
MFFTFVTTKVTLGTYWFLLLIGRVVKVSFWCIVPCSLGGKVYGQLMRGAQKLTGENLKIVWAEIFIVRPGSAKANGREPKSCLGRVFNFKLDSFADTKDACGYLKLKTRPRFCPVSIVHG